MDAFVSWLEFLPGSAGLVAVVGCFVLCFLAVESVRRWLEAREEGHRKLLLEAQKASAAAVEQRAGGQATNGTTSLSGQAKSGSGKPDAGKNRGGQPGVAEEVCNLSPGELWKPDGQARQPSARPGAQVPSADEVDRLRQDSKQLAEITELFSGHELANKNDPVACARRLLNDQRRCSILINFSASVLEKTRTPGFESVISRGNSGQLALVGEDERLRSAFDAVANRVGTLRLRADRLNELVLALEERLVDSGQVVGLAEDAKRQILADLRDPTGADWKERLGSLVRRVSDWRGGLLEARNCLSEVEQALDVPEAKPTQPFRSDSAFGTGVPHVANRSRAIVAGIGALRQRIASSEEGIENLVASVERRRPVRHGGSSHGVTGIESLWRIVDDLIRDNDGLVADKGNLLERLRTAASLMKELNILSGFSFGTEEGADADLDTLLLTDDVARQFYEEKFEQGAKGGFRWEAQMLRRDGKLACHLKLSLLRNTSIAALPSSARVWFEADAATDFGGLFVAETTRDPAEFEAPYKAIARMFEIARSKLVVDVRPLPGKTGVYKTMATVDSGGE